jgi:hypothetical protein
LLPYGISKAGQVPAHVKEENWQRQHKADPETPSHVGEFVIGAAISSH